MLALALPLVLTQLIQILVHTTEVLLLSRLGHPGLAIVFGAIAVVGAAAAWRVFAALRAA